MIPSFKGYRLIFTKRSLKDLDKIDKQNSIKIRRKLDCLVVGNENTDVKKVLGKSCPTYRLRSGDYRVVFEVEKKEITVVVVRVGHRREIYKFTGR